MTVSLSRTVTESQTVFPLYICLARLISDIGVPEVGVLPLKLNQILFLLLTSFLLSVKYPLPII